MAALGAGTLGWLWVDGVLWIPALEVGYGVLVVGGLVTAVGVGLWFRSGRVNGS